MKFLLNRTSQVAKGISFNFEMWRESNSAVNLVPFNWGITEVAIVCMCEYHDFVLPVNMLTPFAHALGLHVTVCLDLKAKGFICCVQCHFGPFDNHAKHSNNACIMDLVSLLYVHCTISLSMLSSRCIVNMLHYYIFNVLGILEEKQRRSWADLLHAEIPKRYLKWHQYTFAPT